MDRIQTERGDTNCNIFSTFRAGSAISHPFTAPDDDGLAGPNLHDTFLRFNAYGALEHDCKFIKLRLLARLAPSRRTVHVSDANGLVAGIDPPDILVDQFVGRHRNPGRAFYERRHTACLVVSIRHQVGERGQRSLVGRVGELDHDRASLVGERLRTFPDTVEAAAPLDHMKNFGEGRRVIVAVPENGVD